MTQVLLRLTVPHGGAREVVDALRSVMLPARLERGCLYAEILRDVDVPEVITYVEEWPLPEDLERRVRSASFVRILTLMEAASSRPLIEFRTVSEVRGLEYIAAVREAASSEPR